MPRRWVTLGLDCVRHTLLPRTVGVLTIVSDRCPSGPTTIVSCEAGSLWQAARVLSGYQRSSGAEVTQSLRLLRPLGQGGMGVLWVAEHQALGIKVVVKFLHDELSDSPAAAKRVAWEAAAAARVQSAHVVKVLDHGVADGAPYIVMELLEGRDLRAVLEARGPLSAEETSVIVHQLAKALAKTHAQGIVHRDVKPSNIFLVDGEGETFVKLLDFGLAHRLTPTSVSSMESRQGAGTPPYMSPEQIVGGALDIRSDMWSLGVVAFECLTGKRPFQGETLGAIALAIHTAPLPRISELTRNLPLAIDAWFALACARSPGDRFATSMDAAKAMTAALGLGSIRFLVAPSVRPEAHDDLTSTRSASGMSLGGRARRLSSRTAGRPWILSGVFACVALGVAELSWVSTPANVFHREIAPGVVTSTLDVITPPAGPTTAPEIATSTAVQPQTPSRSSGLRTTIATRSHWNAPSITGPSPSPIQSTNSMAPTPPYELPDERH